METKIIKTAKHTRKLSDVVNGVKPGIKKQVTVSPNKQILQDLKNSLQSHYNALQELKDLEAKVEEDVKKIGQLKRQEEKRLKRITTDMTLIDISKIEITGFNAIMKVVPKFKSYAAPYKELWQYAQDTVGPRIKKLFEKTEREYIQAKIDAKQDIIVFEEL
jgi:hypothetical protein